MKIETKKFEKFTLVSFDLEGKNIEPSDIRDLPLPEVDASKGIIISGRGPTYLFGVIQHHYHPVSWVAHHVPRLGGGVVVSSHTPKTIEGDLIKFSTD